MCLKTNNACVLIWCMTFNHKPYIRQCLDGFVMQKTNFPFVAIVVDDASTDNEQEELWYFINSELDSSAIQKDETEDFVRIVAPHQTNRNCLFVIILLKYNHWSIKKAKNIYCGEWFESAKYIAFCEGDDYWTNPLKLQKQVDFLEDNPDYTICTHDYEYYYEKQNKFEKTSLKDYFEKEISQSCLYYDFSLDNYFKRWFTQPLTCIYRKGDYLIPRERYNNYRDDIFYYYILKKGKGGFINESMGVYRINDSGTWSTKNDVLKWKDSIYNAYNIYLVEGDERAFTKIERLEKQVVNYYLRSLDLVNVAREMNNYRKMVPHKLFFSLVFSMKSIVLSLFKQGIRKLLHIVIKRNPS